MRWMPTRSAAAAAALFALATAEVVTALVAGAASGLGWQGLYDLFVVTNLVIGLSLALSGWPLAAQRPRNPVGWCLLLGGCCYGLTAAGIALLALATSRGWEGPVWPVVAELAGGGWTWTFAMFLPLALLLFPDGRTPGRRWAWLLVLPAVNGPLFTALAVLSHEGLSDQLGVQGALTWEGYGALAPLETPIWLGILLSYGAGLATLVARYRRGTDLVRRQLLWLVLALTVTLAGFLLDAVLQLDSLLVSVLPIALLPLAIAVAILRHQLLDIRLVVSRSLLYLALTAATVGLYLALVAVLDQTLRREVAFNSPVLVTLVVALAFNPLRLGLQRAVDRTFYGARGDPVQAVAEVGARLGRVGRTAGGGLGDVLDALCTVLRLPWAALSAGGRQVAAHGEPSTPPHVVPLHHGEDQLGDLTVGLRRGESRLDPADERVLGLLAAPVAVALHATLLAADLATSRERMISAREEERRRLRRDLHDGLGPVLTGVALNADAAGHLLASDPARAATLLAQVRDQSTGAIEDVRRLVYDLRPPALDGMGLVGALREYAMVLTRRADGSSLRVTVDAAVPGGELPAAVEVAAYRIVTEALTNVVRHADASAATVTLRVEAGALQVQVRDDGRHAGDWQPGVGLQSIRERVSELGGDCEIRRDGGFLVAVSLPGIGVGA